MNTTDLLTITGNQTVTIIYGYALKGLRLLTDRLCRILLVSSRLVYMCAQPTGWCLG